MKSEAYDCAVRLLTRREHGAEELLGKLIRKGYSAADATEALLECQRLDLQSDRRFVDNICRLRIRQGYGPVRIRQELHQVDSALVAERLQEESSNWLDYALAVWNKRFQTQALSFTAVQKQKQFLLYRGFASDTIALVFDKFRNQTGLF